MFTHDYISSVATQAVNYFLDRYVDPTRAMYERDLHIFFDWCLERGVDPVDVRRPDLEEFIRHLLDERGNAPSSVRRRVQTVRGYYSLAHADELIPRNPGVMLRLPVLHRDPERLVWLDRFQLGALLKTAENTSAHQHSMVAMMSMLGLRVSAACRARIEEVSITNTGDRQMRVREKGLRIHTTLVPGKVWEILSVSIGSREEGPIVLRKNGTEQDRAGAYRWVRTLSEKAGLPAKAHPHSLRRSVIALLLDSGVLVEEVRRFAGHADIRTTLNYHPELGANGVHGSFIAAAALDNMS